MMSLVSGIMQLISYCEPRNVMLVHGEAVKMQFLKQKIKQVPGQTLIIFDFMLHITGLFTKNDVTPFSLRFLY